MKIEEFQSGFYRQQAQFKSFSPAPINHEWIWEDPAINTLLEDATRAVSELNAYSLIVPDVDLFISMHVTKEANTSSRIEGTQTNMEDALKDIGEVEPEKRDDWQEVHNYIDAMNTALTELETLPLSNRLIRQTHAILMRGARGRHKTPGEFRVSQNWIGASLRSAAFVPPHHEEVPGLMSDLELFLHNDRIQVPHLVRIALAHYQFETIHPFLDGNGRIGRLMITLYLVSAGFLNKPSLYLSAYLERHRAAYYDALMMVRESHNLTHWIKFFLTAVLETARNGKDTFHKILLLKNDVDIKVAALGARSENARTIINHLYCRPTIRVGQAIQLLGVSQPTANSLLHELEKLGILQEITGYRRNRLYVFRDYINLFRD
jgi:Fic family protein